MIRLRTRHPTIALRPFGGVTAFDDELTPGGVEFWVSVAGPGASLLLALHAGAASANPSDVLVWQEIAGQLDDAVLKLSADDRRAVLLRYFENRPVHDVFFFFDTGVLINRYDLVGDGGGQMCIFIKDADLKQVGIADLFHRMRGETHHFGIPGRGSGCRRMAHALAQLHQRVLDVARLGVVV